MPAWDRLLHAYGPAIDTPGELARLRSSDVSDAHAGMEHLWGVVLHQGTIYPATAPVVEILRDGLRDNRFPLVRDELIVFLAEVYLQAFVIGAVDEPTPAERERFERALDDDDEDALYGDPDVFGAAFADSVLQLRRASGAVVDLALEVLADAATVPAVELLAYAAAAAPRADAVETLRSLVGPNVVGFAAVHGLSELGIDVSCYLEEPVAGVAAALADPADRRAFAVLQAAALRPRELEDEFPRVRELSARAAVTVALCEAAEDFASLLPAGVAALALAKPFQLYPGWDTFLRAAWRLDPGGPAARAYLAAIADRKDLWEPNDGNAKRLYEDLGLPYNREQCARIAASAPP